MSKKKRSLFTELDIVEPEKDIFTMEKEELIHYFGFKKGTLKDISLLRSLIWQDYKFLREGKLPPFRGNIRSYWYARVKPVYAHAGVRNYDNKYNLMIGEFVTLIYDNRLFDYRDFGFTDENGANRSLGGGNRQVILVAEKVGHYELLRDIASDYDVSIIAFGGQPSVLSTEYFLRELSGTGFDMKEPIPVFTIVDYDPSGDNIADNFIEQLERLGYKGKAKRIDLFHPKRMSKKDIAMSRYKLPTRKSERTKVANWVKKTGGLTAYNGGEKFGLEADAMKWPELAAVFEKEAEKYLKVSKDKIVRRRLTRELVEVLRELLLKRIGA